MKSTITFTAEEIRLMHQIIGHKVRLLREKNNMSHRELAKAMGYKSHSLVTKAEDSSNDKHFNLEHLYKISKIFNVPLSEFF